jgi:DNA helicase-2/ATP-dependent DNA helicase PcrA
MPLQLTNEQTTAATTRHPRLYIEAGPGSGKTTVAAERFGVLRFAKTADRRGILALSFTRSATTELRRRVERRWGSSALARPHRTGTFDRFHCDLLHYMLREGHIEWPFGHKRIEVLDAWNGQVGFQFLQPPNGFKRMMTLHGRSIDTVAVRVTKPSKGIGQKRHADAHLEAGRCTHDDIRNVLRVALRDDELVEVMINYLRQQYRALIVDEIFDADALDLVTIRMAVHAGISVTLIGDPWQALYEWRGATPDLVPKLLDGEDYAHHLVTKSFRFKSEDIKQMAQDLRSGHPVLLNRRQLSSSDTDVVIARTWGALWSSSGDVLPLSFGPIANQSQAALVILLDHIVNQHLGTSAIFASEARSVLRLDVDRLRRDGPTLMSHVIAVLMQDNPRATEAALDALRSAMRELGSNCQLRRLQPNNEALLLRRMVEIKTRLQPSRRLIPGLTIHQAKGREWNTVGVKLEASELQALERGLQRNDENHRCTYVALTRSIDACFQVL